MYCYLNYFLKKEKKNIDKTELELEPELYGFGSRDYVDTNGSITKKSKCNE